jgi:hypothetical protein
LEIRTGAKTLIRPFTLAIPIFRVRKRSAKQIIAREIVRKGYGHGENQDPLPLSATMKCFPQEEIISR